MGRTVEKWLEELGCLINSEVEVVPRETVVGDWQKY